MAWTTLVELCYLEEKTTKKPDLVSRIERKIVLYRPIAEQNSTASS